VTRQDAGRVSSDDSHDRFEVSASRRLAILRGAIDVFWSKGYTGATLRLIAAAAGVEKGHLTYYFKTKDDLLFEVVNDLHDQFAERLASGIAAGGDPFAVLHRVLRHHVVVACVQHRQTSVGYDNMRFLSPVRAAVVARKRAIYERSVLDLVRQCQQTAPGVADLPPEILSKVVLGVVCWAPYWYDPDGKLAPESLATMLADQAVAALFPAPVPAGRPSEPISLPVLRWA
jgi:TetR/AcrR family transcriptional regulator, cholesterol catabolism regulator